MEIIHNCLYDSKNLKEYKVLEVFGKSHRVQIAQHVYWFLDKQIKNLWNEFKLKKTTVSLSERSSFMQGAARGFSSELSKLKSQNPSSNTQEKGLILIEKEKTEAYMKKFYPKVYTSSFRTTNKSSKAYNEGHKHGKKIKLYETIKTNSSIQKRLY